MLIECCMQERTYLRFYGLLAQRFSLLFDVYRDSFAKCFFEKYSTIHRYETNRLRNIAKMFAHLFFTETIDWKVMDCVIITQENTTSSSRIFVKILFQEVFPKKKKKLKIIKKLIELKIKKILFLK